MDKRIYLCIDLKSFYASVECIHRNLDPMTTNLVVADVSRTQKTICLAVTPSLKKLGVSGRPRLFEVESVIKEINNQRRKDSPIRKLVGESYNSEELKKDPTLKVSYIAAVPKMAKYIEISSKIYEVYLKYVSKDDIHVYSIDEVFMDITDYLHHSGKTPEEFARMIVKDVYLTTGITATCGIGTNLYLAKVCMDIVAKHKTADQYGVRIASLDEISYRKELWNHKPLTDFWRVGRGYYEKLSKMGLYTMGDIAAYSMTDFGEDRLYKFFGINAELLIDHAWGYEPCTMKEIKEYKPVSSSLGSGQVLHCPYDYEKTVIVLKEMTEALCLQLVEKGLVTDQIVITAGYDIECLTNPKYINQVKGEVTTDYYGRKVPKHVHFTVNLERFCASTVYITEMIMKEFEKKANRELLYRRINVSANHIKSENDVEKRANITQLSMFADYNLEKIKEEKRDETLRKEKNIQKAYIDIKSRFGKNAIIKGSNLQEGATAIDRNKQIGGHKA